MTRISRSAFALLLVMMACSPVAAATRTWTGAVSDRWSDGRNWDDGVPLAGDDLVFPILVNRLTVSTNDLASGTLFHSITVNAPGSRIGGNGIVLGTGGLVLNVPFLTSLIHGELTFASITLADSQTWRGRGSELTHVGLTNINGKTLTITDAVRIDFVSLGGTGAIIEDSPFGFLGTDSSAYTGAVTVNAGAVLIGGGTAGDINVIGRGFGGDAQSDAGANASLELSGANVGNLTVTGSGAFSLHGNAGTSYAGSLAFLPTTGDPAWFVIADGSIPVACNVTGDVALGNAQLVVRPNVNAAITLIHEQGSGRVTGTFLGLPEGAVFGNGSLVRISYTGGGGSDVTLTPVSTAFTTTTTAIAASIIPSSPGELVSLSATVTSAAGTPAGLVSFYDGGVFLGSSPVGLSGNTFLTTSFEPGPHLFTAAYLGSATLAASQGNVRVSVCAPPILTQQPASQSILQGQMITLAVQASAVPPLSFQWYEGFSGDTSRPVPGATSQTFTPAALTTTTPFWVRVSDDCGSVQSATAFVVVRQSRRRTVSH